MLHKIVETGETDDKCTNLLKYSCYACYNDYFFLFLHQTIHADNYNRYYNHRDRHVGYHICYDYKKLQFSLKEPGITPIYFFHLSMLTMLEMT